MTTDLKTNIKASRVRVPRSRGALSGALLVLLGAWAALIPLVGPAFNFAFTPATNSSFHWTATRGWLEVLPGVVVFVGGLLLLMSSSRLTTSFGAWLAAAGGAWLIIGVPLAPLLNLHPGTPDPTSSKGVRVLEALLFFYAIGAAILFLASVALGRLSVHSVRDVRAAEKRAAAAEAAEAEERRLAEERVAEENRRTEENRLAEERRLAEEHDNNGHAVRDGAIGAAAGGVAAHEVHNHEQKRDADNAQHEGATDGSTRNDGDGSGTGQHEDSSRQAAQTQQAPQQVPQQAPQQGGFPQGDPQQMPPQQYSDGQPQQYPAGQQPQGPPPQQYVPNERSR